MKSLITFATATVLGLAIVCPSQAAVESPPLRTVRFADLELSNIEGAAKLFGRIRGAAKVVCDRYNSRELARLQRYTSCVDSAVSDAVARVDEPVLTEYFARRSASGDRAPSKIASTR
jgi:UrcA family protein